MIIYRTGNPRGNGSRRGTVLDDYCFAAPTPRMAGRWAAYLRAAECHRYIGKTAYAVHVPRGYHRWLNQKESDYFSLGRYNYLDGNRHGYTANGQDDDVRDNVWNGDINEIVDEENFVYEMKEILYRPDEIISYRELTKEEMLEYARGYAETLIVFRTKGCYKQPDTWARFHKIFRPKIKHKIGKMELISA